MSLHKKLKVRLGSYNRLHDLTKAIQLVALSKLKIAQDQRKEDNESLSSFKKTFSRTNPLDHIYMKYMLFPITSDKSCCGAINTNIVDEVFNYTVVLIENVKEFIVFLIGKKGKSFLKKNYSAQYVFNASNLTKEMVSFVTMLMIHEKMNNLKMDICILIFNHLYTIFEQGTSIYQAVSYNHFTRNLYIQLNESIDNIFWTSLFTKQEEENDFIFAYNNFAVILLLVKAFHENELSEFGGRITSMQNASKNALELMQRLRILFNKARQAYITNELIEIVSCLNALME